MEDIKITYGEVAFAVLIFNVIVGLMFGSLPLIAGIKLDKRRRGWIGFAVAVVVGTMFNVIGAYIVSAIFLWLIVRSRAAEPDTVDAHADAETTPDA